MLFVAFVITAFWFLPIPLWLQICITVFGVFAAIELVAGASDR